MQHEVTFAGFGGQGILTAGKLLALAGMAEGRIPALRTVRQWRRRIWAAALRLAPAAAPSDCRYPAS